MNHQTRAIRGGRKVDPTTGAILTPIIQSTTYAMGGVGVHKGFTYSRADNPTVAALESALSSIEGIEVPAVCLGTGMAAIHALAFTLLQTGSHIICDEVVYGGTVRLMREFFTKFGVETTFVDSSDPSNVQSALRENTKLVIIETPANPTMKVTDIAAIAAITRAHGALLAVDNTFLTAVLQDCFGLGADIIIYSTTKYIEGHDSTVGGALLTRDPELRERFAYCRKAVGSIQKPQEAFLTLQGLKTLPIRLREHSRSALSIAKWLQQQPQVAEVYFPGLESHPGHNVAQKQQGDWGGMLAFELRGGFEAGKALMESVQLCTLAENLGATETLITHPASMTHGDVPKEQRERSGITDGLIRLSVGLEDTEDLIADLDQALAKVGAAVV
ncbi:MAG TPA: aminotransferase class I/II-fold pyridoxal phosphate-dependent enzyme [Fimbriimonadaceae bacterium]|nr:aminotransferase class I/II-fold pyridoxal phosphate-dependent enzyme [Fimbriimonadaceae bacterium]